MGKPHTPQISHPSEKLKNIIPSLGKDPRTSQLDESQCVCISTKFKAPRSYKATTSRFNFFEKKTPSFGRKPLKSSKLHPGRQMAGSYKSPMKRKEKMREDMFQPLIFRGVPKHSLLKLHLFAGGTKLPCLSEYYHPNPPAHQHFWVN